MSGKKSQNRIEVRKERNKKSTKITLSRNSLKVTRFVTDYDVTYEVDAKTGYGYNVLNRKIANQTKSTDIYELVEVTREQLASIHEAGTPGFVLKRDGKLYYTQIPCDLTFYSAQLTGDHLCSYCRKLSAKPDEFGGCAKVREIDAHIENYDWIVSGFETFKTNQDSFRVSICNHCI